MRFSIEPLQSDNAFDQWKDAMKAVARLPMGIPGDFRKKVWLSLADNHIKDLRIDWEKTVRFAFNEKSNPDDNKLGLQIVKDLHRTGCTSFSGHDNEEDRAVLKRVLLAYARWNKRVGYCQGFNIIAALLLDVMDRKEDDALKVMVYLIDHVLPESYFANNLRALSVDMAVFRDLLRMTLPGLAKHLDYLQHAAQDQTTGACYEPPLTNVFTMQWFLTLFATCLPKNIVLRVMDSILLEGSEILLRTALTIWGKLARRIMNVPSADEFYTLMGDLSAEMMQGNLFNVDSFIKSIYSIAPFPFPNLIDLREKYTYNIRPFTNTANGNKKQSRATKNVLYSDDDELDEDDIEAISCFPGMEGQSGTEADISSVGPGAFGASVDSQGHRIPYMERMSTDIHALKKQYETLRLRQRQAHIIIAGASVRKTPKPKAVVFVPKIETPTAMNHLFIGKLPSGGKNRIIADGPTIAPISTRSSLLSKQVYAVTKAENRHRRDSSRNNSVNSNSDTLSSAASVETVQDTSKTDNSPISEKVEESSKTTESETSQCITKDENSLSNTETKKDWSTVSLHTVGLDNSDSDSVKSEDEVRSCSVDTNEESTAEHKPTEEVIKINSGDRSKSYKDLRSNQSEMALENGGANGLILSSDVPYRKSKHTMMLQSYTRSVNMVEGDSYVTKYSHSSNNSTRKNSSHVPSTSQHPTPDSGSDTSLSPSYKSKPFNPFPTKHINQNRAKTGLKLGLYSASTLSQLDNKFKKKTLS
ncbi:hypothetical protein SNE40_013824 [Patella caerulea]|uniref:TBC1 domain family member 30 n=1 Tax=Patella caerulea TaxID=87958 RepID=A0AAN8JCC7_PATCE